MKTFSCSACEAETPECFKHEHHEIPQAAGGTDKDIILVCSSCHTRIHSLAYMLLNPKKMHEVEGVLAIAYDSYTVRRRVISLADTVAKEMAAKADSDPLLDNGDRSIQIVVDKDYYYTLLFAAKDRRLSVANLCKKLIIEGMDRIL